MSAFKDESYLQGYMDAIRTFTKELEAYRDYAFDSESYTDEELEGIGRMEAEFQQWLVDHVGSIGEELE